MMKWPCKVDGEPLSWPSENLMKKGQNSAGWNVVNYSIEKMKVIQREEFNGVWIQTNSEVFSSSFTHPFTEGEFSQLLEGFFNQKPDDFLFFFNSYKNKNSTQKLILSTNSSTLVAEISDEFPHPEFHCEGSDNPGYM